MRNKLVKIVGSILLVLALLGWWGYNSYFRPDPTIQAQLADQFGNDFFNAAVAATPAADETIRAGEASHTASFLDKIQAKQAAGIKDEPTDKNESPELISDEAIILKYTPQFQSVETWSTSRLETIYAAAVNEYVQQSKAGTLDHAAWTHKYLQACLSLQSHADAQFYSALNAMEAELKANNLSTTIIAEIETEYADAKTKKIVELVQRAHSGG